jgi:hypothetical protein
VHGFVVRLAREAARFQNMSQAKSFIVKRMTHDGDKGGPDTYHYQKVTNPNPGELIYHGQFASRQVEIADNGPMGSVYGTVYVPVDESKLTSEPYQGGGDVETF